MKTKYMSKDCKGFTLTEMAIVLLIVGVIIGAIWVTSSNVHKQTAINDTIQNVAQIALNVENMYTGISPAADPPFVQQKNSGLFPAHVLNAAGNTQNAWGGAYNLSFVRSGGRLRGFFVTVTLPLALSLSESRELCVSLTSKMQGSGVNATDVATLSAAPPSRNQAQGEGPSNVFINNDDDVTGLGATDIATLVGGAACTAVSYYYPL